MRWKAKLWYVLSLAGMAALVYGFVQLRDLSGRVKDVERRQAELQELRQTLADREAEVARLRQRVDKLTTDPVEIEATIRRDKNLLRPGETVYRVDLDSDQPAPPQQGVQN